MEMITFVWDFAPEWLVLVLSNGYFDGKNNFQCLYKHRSFLSLFFLAQK